ncbi:MAG: electron transfer flavoprotein subunit alpha/FixB family protein [Clostridiales bacterium]|jgi:electron transfer flavoprotein alpha subunit|nr:electron transfer flavoprotein subunit alpha/FixB family protein [Clostridiales bacterium]
MSKIKILVYVQVESGRISPLSADLIKEAFCLSKNTADIYGVAVSGEGSGFLDFDSGALKGLEAVYVFESGIFEIFEAMPYASALKICADELKPDIMMFVGTSEGRALAPAAAALLKTGAAADCTELMSEDGGLIQIRPTFGGSMLAEITTPFSRPQIAVLRAGAFSSRKEAVTEDAEAKKTNPTVIYRKVVGKCGETEPLKKRLIDFSEEKFKEKDIIIAVGGGLREKKDAEIFYKLSEKLGASLMCSRAVVDRGWFSQARQIGLSGRIVSPKLLITFGISGSAEFLSGIKSAERLTAVNVDKDSQIMKIADEAIVGDMYLIAGEMLLKNIEKSIEG